MIEYKKGGSEESENEIKVTFVERKTRRILCEANCTQSFSDKKPATASRILKHVELAYIEGEDVKNYAKSYQINFIRKGNGTRREETPIWIDPV